MTPQAALKAIPTHVITGFLGTGKTTMLLNLMSQKPEDETWAILVNEFGDIGIDGALLSGATSNQQVFIREVPGGCMCCAAGVPMQVALSQLLKKSKPDRLFIEPTGLGHPKEVLKALQAEHYASVLDVHKVITLVDARKLRDERYTNHSTFNEQIAIADVVIGNKADLYDSQDVEQLEAYVQKTASPQTLIYTATQGKLLLTDILGQTLYSVAHTEPCEVQIESGFSIELDDFQLPTSGVTKKINKGEGFTSVGWHFAPDTLFDKSLFIEWAKQLDVERMKAVIKTITGHVSFNLTADGLTEGITNPVHGSRIEIIARNVNDHWEESLLSTTAIDNSSP